MTLYAEDSKATWNTHAAIFESLPWRIHLSVCHLINYRPFMSLLSATDTKSLLSVELNQHKSLLAKVCINSFVCAKISLSSDLQKCEAYIENASSNQISVWRNVSASLYPRLPCIFRIDLLCKLEPWTWKECTHTRTQFHDKSMHFEWI